MFDNENLTLSEKLLKRWHSLKDIRELREMERWEAFAYANHRTKTSSLTPSPVPELKLYSTSGVQAIENFINGFMGNLISQNQNWASFRYESADFTEQDDMSGANEYLGLVQKRVMSELSNSNFYAQDRLAAKDAFIGGCSATFIHNDPDRDICVFDTLPPWDWWCDTNKHGVYDTFFYKKRMSCFKAYKMFGDKLPEELVRIAQQSGGYKDYYDFLLCIYPREGKQTKSGKTIFGKEKKFGAVWMCLSAVGTGTNTQLKGHIISEDGYDMFPVIIHCWDTDGDNPYGTSPVIRALPDLRRLNMLAYETAISVQKINHAPYVMTSAVQEQFSDDPGARIIVPSMEQTPIPLQQQQTIDGVLNLQKDQEEKISRIFYNDMFNYLSRQDKVFTATQVNAVKSEELTLLSAIFGNIQTQKIDKIIKYVIYTMGLNKRLPEGASEALSGKGKNGKLKIVLDSMLAQSLRSYTFRDSGLADIELCERLTQMQWVDALDNVDKNNLVRLILNGNGSDPSVIVDKAQVEQIQKQRAEVQAQQAQMQQQLAQSEMIRNMGGAQNMNNSTGANQYQ